ncbi:hypothetical protein SteCoe_33873 [Stentor coeruleus]|uniref:Uncharacterized protein n=1 Tax=Stentor coeruleus TaxID=5963 RepID=A0A1R2AVR6_9CILI|nr:hypothetical protein SteCoe_33873 [Stentor coeruleus]
MQMKNQSKQLPPKPHETKFKIPTNLISHNSKPTNQKPKENPSDINYLISSTFEDLLDSHINDISNELFLETFFDNSNFYFERIWEELLSLSLEEILQITKPLISYSDQNIISPQKEMILSKIIKAETELNRKKQLNQDIQTQITLIKEQISAKEKETVSIESEFNDYEGKIIEISEYYTNVLVPKLQVKDQELNKINNTENLVYELTRIRMKNTEEKEGILVLYQELDRKKLEYEEFLEQMKELELSNEKYKGEVEGLKNFNRKTNEDMIETMNRREDQMKKITMLDEEIEGLVEEICKVDKEIKRKEIVSSARRRELGEINNKVEGIMRKRTRDADNNKKNKVIKTSYDEKKKLIGRNLVFGSLNASIETNHEENRDKIHHIEEFKKNNAEKIQELYEIKQKYENMCSIKTKEKLEYKEVFVSIGLGFLIAMIIFICFR